MSTGGRSKGRRRAGGLKLRSNNRVLPKSSDNKSLRTTSKKEQLLAMVKKLEISKKNEKDQEESDVTETKVPSFSSWRKRVEEQEEEAKRLEAQEKEMIETIIQETKIAKEEYTKQSIEIREKAKLKAKTMASKVSTIANGANNEKGEEKVTEQHIIIIPYPLLNPSNTGVPVLPPDPFGGNIPVVMTPEHPRTINAGQKHQPRRRSKLSSGSTASATEYAEYLSKSNIKNVPYPVPSKSLRQPSWPTIEPNYLSSNSTMIPYPTAERQQQHLENWPTKEPRYSYLFINIQYPNRSKEKI